MVFNPSVATGQRHVTNHRTGIPQNDCVTLHDVILVQTPVAPPRASYEGICQAGHAHEYCDRDGAGSECKSIRHRRRNETHIGSVFVGLLTFSSVLPNPPRACMYRFADDANKNVVLFTMSRMSLFFLTVILRTSPVTTSSVDVTPRQPHPHMFFVTT